MTRKNKNISVIFMGTPDFSVPSLVETAEKFDLKAVVTVPDKKKGRGRKLKPSPVKKKAVELGIPVLQPEKLKDPEFLKQLEEINPDIIIVIAFRILPEEIFDIPKISIFNIHGSLLPKYRGAAPINWAIINGDKKTGLTSFIIEKKVDTGNILLQKEVEIQENETAGELHDRLMHISPELTTETVELLDSGNFTPKKQDESQVTPAPKLFTDNCKIDWSKSSEEVKNFINGTSPIPGAWTIFNDSRLKMLKAAKSDKVLNESEFFIDKNGFFAGCGEGSVELLEIKPEGKKAMKTEDFAKGYRGESRGRLE